MEKQNVVIAGLAFGDESKGQWTDHLARRLNADLVVRYCGGPNAQHNVVLPGGLHHQFSSFGSGTLAGAPTLLSKHVLVEPLMLANEAKVLKKKLGRDPFETLFIDENCLVITPYHILACRARERARGNDRHGTAGVGLGEAVNLALKKPDLALRMKHLHGEYPKSPVPRLRAIWDFLRNDIGEELFTTLTPEAIVEAWNEVIPHLNFVSSDEALDKIKTSSSRGSVIFEGSQGVLLDQDYGFHPYTTWSKTTPTNALELCKEAGLARPYILGLTRTYLTRHGLGPLPTENIVWPGDFTETHTKDDSEPGRFRVGCLDWNLLNYAGKVVSPDGVAVSHLDRLPTEGKVPVCTDYGRQGLYQGWRSEFGLRGLTGRLPKTEADQVRMTRFLNGISMQIDHVEKDEFVNFIADAVGAPVVGTACGPTHEQRLLLKELT